GGEDLILPRRESVAATVEGRMAIVERLRAVEDVNDRAFALAERGIAPGAMEGDADGAAGLVEAEVGVDAVIEAAAATEFIDVGGAIPGLVGDELVAG